MKIGSLFDGSGGFPLAGAMCGFTPAWASEVEPYPIAVTKSRFPTMKHLGNVCEINGANIEPVDIITFGSPCQDMPVAGKRAGLKHEDNGDQETTRSGLFMEAVRIIKEMRGATNGEYPRFAVWENVPGAFSSNKGEDFKIVLEELIKIVEPNAAMPEVPKSGWPYADCYVGDGWSLAYRVFDAQYLRTAQRRRRIYLVLDFRGERAEHVLFEREGLRGYFAESRTPWQGTPAEAQGSAGADDREGEGLDVYNQALTGDKSKTLSSSATDSDHIPCIVYSVENHPADSRVNLDESGKVQTLTSRMGTGGGNVSMVMEPFVKSARARSADDATTWKPGKVANTLNTFDLGETRANELVVETPVYCLQGNGIDRADTAGCNGKGVKEDICYTLNTIDRPAVVYAVDQGGGKSSANVSENKAPTLCTTHGGNPAVAYETPIAIDRAFFNQGQNALYDPQTYEDGTNQTLVAKGPSAVLYWDGWQQTGTLTARNAGGCQRMPDKDNFVAVIETTPRYIVRRLTPTECARLQGFPDRWGDIETKSEFTDEEYAFWIEVRVTHAVINGREPKTYGKKQMLTWYNKLHTDSAEYKMWGNGIALPCALYVMQGIADVINK